MAYIAVFIAGVVIGAVVVFMVNQRNKQVLENQFKSLCQTVFESNRQNFLDISSKELEIQRNKGISELDAKKQLIDQSLTGVKDNLQKMENLVRQLENDREKKYGELSTQLKMTAEQTCKLQDTAGKLQAALSNTKVRGQWGERMAEDVLRLTGMIEGINYVKQKEQESNGSRPDFCFLLPRGLKVNMDVKFPLNSYLKYLEETAEENREKFKDQFLKDTRQRIKEVTNREYINNGTVDYVLVFIPNERVFGFINENDGSIFEDALRSKVILCSPLTLYSILLTIHQACDNFTVEQRAGHILEVIRVFQKEWDNFKSSMDKMGKKIQEALDEYSTLTSARTRKLDASLSKIEELRAQQQVEEPARIDEPTS